MIRISRYDVGEVWTDHGEGEKIHPNTDLMEKPEKLRKLIAPKTAGPPPAGGTSTGGPPGGGGGEEKKRRG